jgi:hypothetical protein
MGNCEALITSSSWGISVRQLQSIIFGKFQGCVTIIFVSNIFMCNNLSMKGGSLFCFVVMRSIESGCFRLCSWCLWRALDEKGCMGLVP